MDVNKKSDTRDHHIQDVFGAKSSGKQKEKSRGGELGQGFPSRSGFIWAKSVFFTKIYGGTNKHISQFE
jgi:hypothetical protein